MDGIYILKTFTSWYSIGLNRGFSPENYKSDSDSSDIQDLFHDLKDYTLNDSKSLWVERSTCQVTESLVPLTEEDPVSEISVDAFLGIVEVMNTYHLGVVTRSEIVAELDLGNLGLNKKSRSKIMTIKDVKFFPIRCNQDGPYGTEDDSNLENLVNSTTASPSMGVNMAGAPNLSNLITVGNSGNGVVDPEHYQMQEEVFKIIENMEKILSTGYYYSHDTDLTNTLQSLYLDGRVPLRDTLGSSGNLGKNLNTLQEDLMGSASESDGQSRKKDRKKRDEGENEERKELLEEIMERNRVLYGLSKRDFNWCYKISRILPKRWKTVVIQGHVGYRINYIDDEKIETLIIGRRNVKRSGTRYIARGIDEDGNVANFVETEVRIRVNHEMWYSYSQHRGSVPVFWEQLNVTSPVILYNYHHNIRSFSKHLDILKDYYRPCDYSLFVNLLDIKENEKVLTESYMHVVEDYNAALGFKSNRRSSRSKLSVQNENSSDDDDPIGGSSSASHDSSASHGSKRGRIELVNYNYNVNAKWSTHEILVKYILDELNEQFNSIGFFNEELYLQNEEADDSALYDIDFSHSALRGMASGESSFDRSVNGSYGKSMSNSGQEHDHQSHARPDMVGSANGNHPAHATDDPSKGTDAEFAHKRGLQRGVIRTNCLDCLDRTNIFQWISSWVVLNKILNNRTSSSTGGTSILDTGAGGNLLDDTNVRDVNFNRLKQMLLTPGGVTKEENTLFTTFTDLWCDHGDNISIHYSGTQSTLSERVKQTNTSLNSLLHYSKTMVQRFYHSLFQDNQRQTVFNILSPYTSTGYGATQREKDELLLLDPLDREAMSPEHDRAAGERVEARHGLKVSGVASRVVNRVDRAVRGARERRLLNDKYYIQDPFVGEAKPGPDHDQSSSSARGLEPGCSSDSDTHSDASRAQFNMPPGTLYPTNASTRLAQMERAKQAAEAPESSDSIFDKLQKEIMSKLTIKTPILPSLDDGSKSILDLKLLKEQREKLEEELEEVDEAAEAKQENLLRMERSKKSVDQLRVWVGSWNIGAHSIDVNENVLAWMELKQMECDLYVFSFQEFVELNFINIATGRTDENKEYEFEYFIENMFKLSTNHLYEKITSISMTGLYLVIFVRKSLKPHIRDVLITNVKTGLNYNIGNKGSVGIQFNLFDYTLSFLNVHLNFGKNLNVGRIELLEYILKNAFKEFNKNVLDNDIFILGGDFNFHVQLEKQIVLNLLKKMEYGKLLNYDEFNMAKMIGIPILNKLYEADIRFQPTYKYKDGTKYYTTKRSPAWCDRIIFGGKMFENKKVNILSYKRNDNLMISDHRPVSSIILVDLK